ncbi:MAG TPA: FAD-dependent oxidoreductase, partial [Stellaceae bacterium]|nr:FAD-dependent oxidoreductase [Stellaceae bacterium]
MQRVAVRCCIAGGGPAGMMAGLLLARAGVDVVVLEKHADFFRDFRGDTIHPSTLALMDELGSFDELMKLPHQEAHHLSFQFGDLKGVVADFDRTKIQHPFVAFMPQWDFLDFLARRAARYPTFSLKMSADVTGIIEENGRIAGVTATTPHGPLEVRADLVIAADGRASLVREQSGLAVDDFGAPMDVLWFGLPRRDTDPDETMGRFEPGRFFIAIDRRDYWQCGYVIAKGSFDAIRQKGLPAFQQNVATIFPEAAGRVSQLDTWDKIKLLTVQVNRLKRWYRPGMLCIGDAAHAMSPVGGVGINLAVQDAVAASNILADALVERRVTIDDLAKVQKRREFPMRMTQAFQVLVQNRVLAPALSGTMSKPPLAMRLLQRFPALRALPARGIGVGVRPEHIATAPRWPEKEPSL